MRLHRFLRTQNTESIRLVNGEKVEVAALTRRLKETKNKLEVFSICCRRKHRAGGNILASNESSQSPVAPRGGLCFSADKTGHTVVKQEIGAYCSKVPQIPRNMSSYIYITVIYLAKLKEYLNTILLRVFNYMLDLLLFLKVTWNPS